jgi:hypothetical protein
MSRMEWEDLEEEEEEEEEDLSAGEITPEDLAPPAQPPEASAGTAEGAAGAAAPPPKEWWQEAGYQNQDHVKAEHLRLYEENRQFEAFKQAATKNPAAAAVLSQLLSGQQAQQQPMADPEEAALYQQIEAAYRAQRPGDLIEAQVALAEHRAIKRMESKFGPTLNRYQEAARAHDTRAMFEQHPATEEIRDCVDEAILLNTQYGVPDRVIEAILKSVKAKSSSGSPRRREGSGWGAMERGSQAGPGPIESQIDGKAWETAGREAMRRANGVVRRLNDRR